jgi:hypothetical protein
MIVPLHLFILLINFQAAHAQSLPGNLYKKMFQLFKWILCLCNQYLKNNKNHSLKQASAARTMMYILGGRTHPHCRILSLFSVITTESSIFFLPVVKRRFADPNLAADLRNSYAVLRLLKRKNNQRFGEIDSFMDNFHDLIYE